MALRNHKVRFTISCPLGGAWGGQVTSTEEGDGKAQERSEARREDPKDDRRKKTTLEGEAERRSVPAPDERSLGKEREIFEDGCFFKRGHRMLFQAFDTSQSVGGGSVLTDRFESVGRACFALRHFPTAYESTAEQDRKDKACVHPERPVRADESAGWQGVGL